MEKYTKDSYSFLLSEFPGNIIYDRYKALLTQIVAIVNEFGLGNDDVFINTDNLCQSLLDYFTDISRIKEFHGMEKINVQKIYSYTLYWFLKRNPIQIRRQLDNKFNSINEKVALIMLVPRIFIEQNVELPADDNGKAEKKLIEFLKLLYYNFKFRVYTQQSLELMLSAFFSGCCMIHQKEA